MPITRLVALAMVMLHTNVPAQSEGSTQSRSELTRILTHTFVNPSREFVRIRLVADETYLATLNRARIRLEVRPVSPGVRPPRIRRGPDKTRPGFIIEPRVTAEYEIRALRPGKGRVRLTVDRRVRKP